MNTRTWQNDLNKLEQNSLQIIKKTSHKTRSSAVTDIALEREGEKREKKRNCYNTGYMYSYLVLRYLVHLFVTVFSYCCVSPVGF